MGAALLAGALAALAMPPLYWLPLAVLGIATFVWLWQTAPGPQSALLRGWAWGTGHFAVGSYWIIEAFFVPPADYDYFLEHGNWPDKTMFVLEEYGSQSKGSINLRGHYQTEFMGLDVEVKDASRFPDKWAYFGFDGTQTSSSAMSPGQNACWKCHDQNAAVEHSFVQFYPALLTIAKEKKTIKNGVKLE